jgi:hypothetical protein
LAAPRPASPLQRLLARPHLLPRRCTASPGTPHRAGSAVSLRQWWTAPPPSARELAAVTTTSTGATPGFDRLADAEGSLRHATPAATPLRAKKRRGSPPPALLPLAAGRRHHHHRRRQQRPEGPRIWIFFLGFECPSEPPTRVTREGEAYVHEDYFVNKLDERILLHRASS